MESATLIEWLAAPGDQIKRGDLIAVVETDKGAIEIEVFEDGVLERYLVELDSEVAVGEPLAEIRTGSVALNEVTQTAVSTESPSDEQDTVAAAVLAEPVLPEPAVPALARTHGGQRVSPAARQLATEQGVDISALQGSGPAGAVVYADVQAAVGVGQTGTKKEAATEDPAAKMRRAIAAAMARGKREIPHYYLSTTVDVEAAMQWLAQANTHKPPAERILAPALFIKASALALCKFGEFNGAYLDDTYTASPRVNVGVAIAIRGGGLVAPAIHDTDQLSLDQLMAGLRDLTQRVRAGRYRASEFRDPTVTVTSLGDRGVESVFGIIYPPQVACIGFGKVVDRPWSMADRGIVSRQTVTISLSADHRVSDGRRGALLLNTIAEMLNKPETL
jgi:pyruvate dehydrogenase E2 component (dihydrolipoamide acetyltransferase)